MHRPRILSRLLEAGRQAPNPSCLQFLSFQPVRTTATWSRALHLHIHISIVRRRHDSFEDSVVQDVDIEAPYRNHGGDMHQTHNAVEQPPNSSELRPEKEEGEQPHGSREGLGGGAAHRKGGGNGQ